MPMHMGFRWYGEGNDAIKLSDIKQIPGVTSIVWALHHKMPGEIWTEDYVLGMARHYLPRAEIPIFLSKLREITLNEKSNKTSRRPNHHVRELLLTLGYYHDHDL